MSSILKNLNPPQKKSVSTLEGPLMVLAGAGSGKTRVLTRRIANIVQQGISPHRIIAVTFTNKAAQEMKERVEELIGKIDGLWIGTFHSIAARLLRMYYAKADVSRYFVIYDADDQKRLIKRILKELKVQPDAKIVRECINLFEAYRRGSINTLFKPYSQYYRIYREQLEKSDAIDFTGLLEYVLRLKDVLPQLWDYVLVDEFQDTSKIQFDFLKMMVSKNRNICVVGDDDQSIYSWRGANPAYLLRFKQEFKGAHTVRLEQNYRSTGNIIKAASFLVANNENRHEKTLWTSAENGDPIAIASFETPAKEAKWIVKTIKELKDNFDNFAVLYRLNAMSRNFEEELRRNKIPYRLIGGLRFYSRSEIKDILSYLRLALNKNSETDLLRVINKPRRGVGKKSIERLFKQARSEDKSIWESLQELPVSIKGRSRKGINAFRRIIEELTCVAKDSSAVESIDLLLELTNSVGYGSLKDEEEEDRFENILELRRSMSEFTQKHPESTLHEFLDEVSLLSSSEEEDGEEGVNLMTIHAAKGLEFDYVFLPGWEKGIFPLIRQDEVDMEEERRLAYVSITRARKRVFITKVGRRGFWGAPQQVTASPFLDELPPECISWDQDSFVKTQEKEGGFSHYADIFKDKFGKFDKTKPSSTRSADSRSRKSKIIRKTKSATKPENQPSAENEKKIRPGVIVSHPKFGEGRVKVIAGRGKMRKAIVYFKSCGKKIILTSFLHPITD
ncbi:MAG: ATP-dependent helicase [Myxococcota bacterium]